MADPIQITRPQDCPACVSSTATEGCGLLTLSASQLGAVLALMLGGLFYLIQIVDRASSGNGTLLGSSERLSDQEFFFTEEFWVILFITALYYAVAEWRVEEQDYRTLRAIKWPSYAPSWLQN